MIRLTITNTDTGGDFPAILGNWSFWILPVSSNQVILCNIVKAKVIIENMNINGDADNNLKAMNEEDPLVIWESS